jgi:hypothetical protein
MVELEKEGELVGLQKDYAFFLENFKRDLKKFAVAPFH